MKIQLESPLQADVIALIEALDAYQMPLYPAESHHGVDIATLAASNVRFAVARDETQQAIACGAILLTPQYGELKRMYVSPACRGHGVAKALLLFLEDTAKAQGCRHFVLETGYLQHAAITLYAGCGYSSCAPFGDYQADPNSVFMAKTIT